MVELRFAHKGEFGKEIRRRVNDYFEVNKISRKGDWRLYLKAFVFLFSFSVIYLTLMFSYPPFVLQIVYWILLVPVCAGIGFSIMHDANHGAFSDKAWVNNIFGWTLNLLGANKTIWKKKHNGIHHHGTNIDGEDEDIEAKPLMRFHKAQKWFWIHQYQHRYWWLAYGLLYFFWITVKDFTKYFSGKILNKKIKFSFWNHFDFWFSKIFFYFLFIRIPIANLGPQNWAIGFFVFAFLLGIVIAVVFQIAHMVEGLEQPTLDEANGCESVEHQIATTADFAVDNQELSHWVGGLNFQIEHHLFFGISHVHYPIVHKIVKKTCEDYNFPMKIFPTFWDGFKSHIAKLKELGKKPKDIVVQL